MSPPLRSLAARLLWQTRQARPTQLPPGGDWNQWLILTGRGWGKTRTGAEHLYWQAYRTPRTRWAVVAPTWSDLRNVCMEGESGLLQVADRYRDREYDKSRGILRLSNGSIITGYSADKPDRLRGPQHHGAWADELAAWRYTDAWDQLTFGLRLGARPTTVITTTPRPTPLIRRLTEDPGTAVTRGSTYDNAANLAPAALDAWRSRYEGTRLGRQELHGEIITDTPGALWTADLFDKHRVTDLPDDDPPVTYAVGVDPAVTAGEDADETGIITAVLTRSGNVYVTGDHSGRYPPDVWAAKVAALDADTVFVEVNQGGDLVRQVLAAAGVRARIVSATAVRGKAARAEPVAVLYERGKVRHVGTFPALEDQAASWVPGDPTSPDRVDALVWAVAGLTGRIPRPATSFRT